MGGERGLNAAYLQESWTRPARLALLLFLIVALGSLTWLVHSFYDPVNDASLYLLTARSILDGQGYSYLGQPFTIRPPGFAVLLLPVLSIFGQSFLALNLFSSLFGILTLGLLFVQVRPRLGPAVSLTLVLTIWFNPFYQRTCNQVLSELPGCALMLLALIAARWAGARPGALRYLLVGLLISVAAYVRSVNLLILPALLVSLWFSGRKAGQIPWRKMSLLVAVVVLTQLPWSLRNARMQPDPPAEQTFLYSYGAGQWHQDTGDPRSPRVPVTELLGRIPKRLGKLVPSLGSRMQPEVAEPQHFVVGGLLLLALLTMLIRHRTPAEFLGLLIFLVLGSYFVWRDRLALPLYLLAAAAAVEVLVGFARRLLGARYGPAVVGLSLLTLLFVDLHPRQDWPAIEAEHQSYTRLAAEVEQHFAPEQTLGAVVGWHLSVRTGRPIYSLRWALERSTSGGPQHQFQRYGLEGFIVERRAHQRRSDVRLMQAAVQAGAVLYQAEPFALVRLRGF